MGVLLFFIGLIIGIGLVAVIRRKPKASGVFVIDFSDPLKDVCRLELAEDINSIYQKKQIILDVRTYGDETQN